MNCKRCGSPLPSEGIVCKFCGAAMNQEQVKYQNKMKDKDDQRITLLSEKYGHSSNTEYREVKQNNVVGIIAVVLIVVFLIVLAILIK